MPDSLSGVGRIQSRQVMASAPASPAGMHPADGHGLSLLRPPNETAELRRRRERPAEVGRSLLIVLGAVCSGASSALWATTHVSVVAVALLGFGLLLVAFGATLHLVLLRNRDRWPEAAHAWAEGIELLLHDGELRAVAWTDPKLALDLFVRPDRRSTDAEHLLVWRTGSPIPPCDLSEEGLARLLQMATTHDLRLTEFRQGRKGREARAYEIRGRHDHPATDPRAGPADAARLTP